MLDERDERSERPEASSAPSPVAPASDIRELTGGPSTAAESSAAELVPDAEVLSLEAQPRLVPPQPPPSKQTRERRRRLHELIQRDTDGRVTDEHLRDFRRLDLRELDLRRFDLSGADLTDCDFTDSELDGASFRNSRLRRAKLEKAHGLATALLAGADVSGASLPPTLAKFELLSSVTETMKSCRALLYALLGASAYSLLIVGTTTDAALAAGTGHANLPLLGSEVPTRLFLVVVPMLLSAFFAYFHLCLCRMWEGCATLPAIFSNGHTLDEKMSWLVLGLMRPHIPLIRSRPQLLGGFQRALAVTLLYGLVPITLYVVWARAAALRRPSITAVHGIAVIGCAVLGYVFHLCMKRAFLPQLPMRPRTGAAAIAVLLASVLAPASVLQKDWPLPGYSPSLRHFRGADMNNADLPELNAQVADFSRATLRDANLESARLAAADFRGARLARATLRRADLAGADLREADLRGSNCDTASLQGVRALGADFSDGYLYNADLQRGNFENAHFCNAILTKANLGGARLVGANLSGANLVGARGLSDAQLSGACGDAQTKLPAPLTVPLCSDWEPCELPLAAAQN